MDFSAYYDPTTDTVYFQGQSYTRRADNGILDSLAGLGQTDDLACGCGTAPGHTTEDYLADLEQSAWDLLKQVRDLRDRLS